VFSNGPVALPWHRWFLGLGVALGVVLLVASPGGAGILDASWIAPIANTDGSPLTDLAFYRIYYGTDSAPCPGSSFVQVASSTPSPPSNEPVTFTLTGLSTGTLYYGSITAVDTSGNESACSTPTSAVAQLDFAVSPIGTLNFGTVALGSVVTQTFAVQNTGGGTVSGTASVSAPFSVVSGGAFSLVDVGAIQAVTVAFGPTISATVSGNVNVTANGGTISRIVTGIGVGADTTPPAVAITSPTSLPTYSTSSSSLTLAGTASDNVGVTQVAWASSGGGSGTASGTTSWTAGGIVLQPGTNVLTVTAQDAAGNTGTATLTVTLTVTSSDTTPPTVAITSPTSSSTYSTSSSPLTLGGTASDNNAVTQVTWVNSRGGSGTASGTTSWTASGIPIQPGTNVLTVTAQDAAGNNTATASVTVHRKK